MRYSIAALSVVIGWISLAIPLLPNWLVVSFIGLAVAASAFTDRFAWPREQTLCVLAFAVMVLSWLIACVLSVDPSASLQRSVAWAPATAIYGLLVFTQARPGDRHLLMLGLPTAGLIMAIAVIVASCLAATPQQAINSLSHPLMVVPNDIVIAGILSPLVFGADWTWSRRAIAFLFIHSVLIVACVFLQSRLGLALSILLLLPVVGQLLNRRLLWLGLSALLATGLGGLLFEIPIFSKTLDSLHSRWVLWQTAWHMFLERPWSGWGPQIFGELYRSYQTQPIADTRLMPWPHNLWLETLMGTGILGGLGVFLSVISHSMKAARLLPREQLLSIAWCALGFIVAATFEASWLRLWVALLFATTCGLVIRKSINRMENECTRQH